MPYEAIMKNAYPMPLKEGRNMAIERLAKCRENRDSSPSNMGIVF
jgi:hypothetical protein